MVGLADLRIQQLADVAVFAVQLHRIDTEGKIDQVMLTVGLAHAFNQQQQALACGLDGTHHIAHLVDASMQWRAVELAAGLLGGSGLDQR